MPDKDIADRLRQIREGQGFAGKKTFSTHLGLSASAWAPAELGKNYPSADTLMRLAELGYSPDWILLGDEPMMLADKRAALARSAESVDSEGSGVGRVFDLISDTYDDLGLQAPVEEMLMEAAKIWGKAKRAATGYEGRKGAAAALVGELRSQLETHAAASKRSA